MRRGDFVRTYFDTCAFGAQIVLGRVIKVGSATATVEWESGCRNRIQQGYTAVALVTDADLLEMARSCSTGARAEHPSNVVFDGPTSRRLGTLERVHGAAPR